MNRFINDAIVRYKYDFIHSKPLLFLRVLNHYKNLILRKHPLTYVELVVNFKCNLKCAHCSQTKLVKPESFRKLSVADYRRLSQECIKLGVKRLVVGGGEALLCPELEEILNALQPPKFFLSLLTNGTLLNKDKILRLKRIGVDKLTISLDSSISEEHDTFRGDQGSFAKAFEALNLALGNGLFVDINTTVMHDNLRSSGMLGLINFCVKKKMCLHLILRAPVGRWSDHTDNLITDDDMEFINSLNRKYPYIRADIHFSSYFKSYCPAVRGILYITPYGDVFPCAFLHFSLGNVLEESLVTIRERGLKLKIFSTYSDKCIAVQDRDFLTRFQSVSSRKEILPLNLKEVFPNEDITY